MHIFSWHVGLVVLIFFYLIFGGYWAYYQWSWFVQSEANFFKRERQRFLDHHRISGNKLPPYLQFEWRSYVDSTDRLRAFPPNVNDHAGEIVFDLFLWWISLAIIALRGILFIGRKAIRKLFNSVVATKVAQIRREM